ncbi:MAG TPA: hypothetical protein C5S51_08425 [Methanosarcinaceae archaeon]|nr:hypothetical protein [Methanosarcinaceae archaeon]
MQNELLDENDLHLDLNQTIKNFIPFIRSEYSFKLDRKTKIQLYLALAAFITFGIGDSITGAFMMSFCGVCTESNPIARHIMVNQGGIGLILFKLWVTVALLTVVIVVQRLSVEPIYWTTNGFLFSFGVGGFLATTANLMRTFQFDVLDIGVPSPVTVILIYLGLTAILTVYGTVIDNRTKGGK